MAKKFVNLARMTTSTTGTGVITLGSAATGCLSFASAGITDGDTCSYGITDGANSEVGLGTYAASGTTLTRTTVIASTNGGAAISLSGTAEVFICPLADDFAPTGIGQGKQLLAWVPAGAMTPNTTNGPGAMTPWETTNLNMVNALYFDPTTSESAQFHVAMPSAWNEGTVSFVPLWLHGATTTNFGVVWALSGVAISDDDTMDVAFGTAQTSTDTGGTTSDLYIGPESAAITIAGTPATSDFVNFKISRLPAEAADTLAVDAGLVGVKVYYTTDAVVEA